MRSITRARYPASSEFNQFSGLRITKLSILLRRCSAGPRYRCCDMSKVALSPTTFGPIPQSLTGQSTPSPPRARFALLAWVALVSAGGGLVGFLVAGGRALGLAAPPFHAAFQPVFTIRTLLTIGVGAFGVIAWPRLARTMSWRALLWGSVGAAGIWTLALANIQGLYRLPPSVGDYLPAVARIDDLGSFLHRYTEFIALPSFSVHAAGHPPGPVLTLWGLREVGLTSVWWGVGLFIIGGLVAVPAVLVAAREVAGEAWARRAAPFVVFAPVAIWVGASADALFSGIVAVGAALVIVATGRADHRGDLLAVGGGIILGFGIFFSYGLVLIGVVPLAVAVHRRRFRPVAFAMGGAIVVVIAFAAMGFWWFDGLAATRARYFAGIASRRPYPVFLLANLSALALVVGPAIAVGMGRLRDRALWVLVGAALAAVALADLSGMSKAEVERIWLPFTPWLLLAGGAVMVTRLATRSSRWRSAGWWLAPQVAIAILIESLVKTAW